MIIEASFKDVFIVFIYIQYLTDESLIDGYFSNFQRIFNNTKGIMPLMITKQTRMILFIGDYYR